MRLFNRRAARGSSMSRARRVRVQEDAGVIRPVTRLRPGETGIITSILQTVPERLVKLSSLGVMPGAEVTLVQREPRGGPSRSRETSIALDGERSRTLSWWSPRRNDHEPNPIRSRAAWRCPPSPASRRRRRPRSSARSSTPMESRSPAPRFRPRPTPFPDRVYKGYERQEGELLRSRACCTPSQAPMWTVSIKAEGLDPVGVKIVARDAQQTLYFSDDAKLTAEEAIDRDQDAGLRRDPHGIHHAPRDAAAEDAPLPPISVPGAARGAPRRARGRRRRMRRRSRRCGRETPKGRSTCSRKRSKRSRTNGSAAISSPRSFSSSTGKGRRRFRRTKPTAARSRQGRPARHADRHLHGAWLGRQGGGCDRESAEARTRKRQGARARARASPPEPGRIDEAIALNERVLAAKPDNTEVLVALADLYNRNKAAQEGRGSS